MIPARRSATSRHISSTILRTSLARRHARPISSTSIVQTTGKRPTIERITCQNSKRWVYRRGYSLDTTSKQILCFQVARHVKSLDVYKIQHVFPILTRF